MKVLSFSRSLLPFVCWRLLMVVSENVDLKSGVAA